MFINKSSWMSGLLFVAALSQLTACTSVPARNTALYLGKQPGCNNGIATTNASHMNCQTEPLGYTVKNHHDARDTLYVGVMPGINAGVVTTDPQHNGGETRPIGHTITAEYGGTQLFKGIEPGCNEGVVSAHASINGCQTTSVGWTYPSGSSPLVSAVTPDRPLDDTPLFVGTQPGCNEGVTSVDRQFMNCQTQPIGSTVRTSRNAETPLYVGLTPGINADIVSTNAQHNGGKTRPIGYLTTAEFGGTQMYVGLQHGCNQGIVTSSPQHNGCATQPIGWTYSSIP